ncbi:MAG TPA: GNAT family N-acetyltransferase [Chthoniobacterales bacterium]
MSLSVSTREFRSGDYDAAVQLWTRVDGVEVAEGDSKEDLVSYISRNPHLSRVAEDGSRIVGAVLCGHDGRRGFIYHLAVEPAYQGKALGRRLVDECLDGLRRAGIKRALILVAADNPRGRSFWRASGWEDVSGALVMGIDL